MMMLARCDEAMAIAERNAIPSVEDKVRFRRDGAYSARLCTHAVDLLFEGSGGDALYELRDIQRAFRDVHAANSHNALNWDVAATLFHALGIDPAQHYTDPLDRPFPISAGRPIRAAYGS